MNTYDQSKTTPESDIIRADIEHTRETMDQTLDELGTKMKPRHLMDEMLGFLHLDQIDGTKMKEQAGAAAQSVGQAANRAAKAITGVVREHPIPTLLISAGLVWAFYESHRRSHNGNGLAHGDGNGHTHQDSLAGDEFEGEWEADRWKEKVQQGLESAKEGTESTAQEVKAKVTTTARAVGQKASQIKNQMMSGVQRGYKAGREKFVHTTQTHPLHVGLGFLAAGVLLGLALPASHKEDQWVGQAADRVKGRVKATGENLLDRGKTVATAAAEAVKKTASEQGLTPQALKEKVQRVASDTQQAAQRAVEQQGLKQLPAQPEASAAHQA